MPRITKPIDKQTSSKLDGILGIAAAEKVSDETAALFDVAGTPVKKVAKTKVLIMDDADLGDDPGKASRPEEFI